MPIALAWIREAWLDATVGDPFGPDRTARCSRSLILHDTVREELGWREGDVKIVADIGVVWVALESLDVGVGVTESDERFRSLPAEFR